MNYIILCNCIELYTVQHSIHDRYHVNYGVNLLYKGDLVRVERLEGTETAYVIKISKDDNKTPVGKEVKLNYAPQMLRQFHPYDPSQEKRYDLYKGGFLKEYIGRSRIEPKADPQTRMPHAH